MFSTSKDVLFLVLAFSILLLTVLFAWILVYIIMIFREVNRLAKGVEEKVKRVDELLVTIKEKIEHSTSYLGLLVEVVRQGLAFVREKKEKKGRRSKEE